MKTLKTRTRQLVAEIIAATQSPEIKQSTKEKNQQIHEEIQRKAYELFLERGCQHGHDLEDWEKAQRIVLARHKRKTNAK